MGARTRARETAEDRKLERQFDRDAKSMEANASAQLRRIGYRGDLINLTPRKSNERKTSSR